MTAPHRPGRRVVALASALVLTAALVATTAAGASTGAPDRAGNTSEGVSGASDAPASLDQEITDLNSTTAAALADTLVGPGITVTDVDYTGEATAAGSFTGMEAQGIGEGILLSSGNVADVVGPNDDDAITTGYGAPGDPVLDALVDGGTEDAAVLTIEFEPTAAALEFAYVFASDEYNEYVGSDYNDVFALQVNGRGCATVQGAPVAVNNVNNDTRAVFYNDNDLDDVATEDLTDVEMDGFTNLLQCHSAVTPGETNTLRLAIADRGDDILDSAVFLAAESLETTPPVSPFIDVSIDDQFFEDIEWMLNEGISTGYPDGSYKPSAVVTRQAMSAFMYRLAGSPTFADPATPTFSDVGTGHQFFTEIEWMAEYGISTGFAGGIYKPNAAVTRQSMSAFMYRLAGNPVFDDPAVPSFLDVGTSHPFFTEIEWMADGEITTGFPGGVFKPGVGVTRQSMSAFMHRLADGPGVDV